MILWPQPDGSTLATPQPAHAVMAGALMAHLAERPEPFSHIVNAAVQHDVAWQGWEQAPQFDAETGLPLAFNAVPGHQHVPMWENGVRLALANWGLWAALLILRHGSHIYRMGILRDPSPESRAALLGYIAREPEWGAAMMAQLGVTEEQVAPLSLKLAMVDAIALALCWGKESFPCGGPTLTRVTPFHAVLDPWPLALPELTVSCEALRLRGPYADAAALRAALAEAPRETLGFRLTPA
ncbi:DUF3891 family protein [Rhodovarius lipocyclicus]|uniref:DUF3891 family protein n=1 Tax=Rhodovarius lipocyclicus TaxID=268410 RepID=UPI00135B64F2|nr:DUF3891 family protein [Rhodovarius lipocyclicus]